MKLYYSFIAIILLLVMFGCGSDNPPAVATHATITQNQAANASYSGIYDEPVQLTDGKFEGEPFIEGSAARPRVDFITDLFRTGDLDGKAGDEALAAMEENSGGTGHFLYLSVLSKTNDSIITSKAKWIGDRVDVIKLEIDSGQIILELIEQGEGDAACCPTQLATYQIQLTGDSLSVVNHEITGKLSLDLIAGTTWQLINSPMSAMELPQDVTVTLQIDSNIVSGSAGCNNYFGSITEGPNPGNIQITKIGATKKLCPDPQMSVEDQYLAYLPQVGSYSFISGHLALIYYNDDGVGTLLFDKSQPVSK